MKALTIVGGGLAGLSLGRALAVRGLPVDLHEAGEYPRHKVCGEFIAGLKPEVRTALDLDPFLNSTAQHWTVRWHDRQRTLITWRLPEPALGVSRWTLDRDLAEAFVAAGGRLHTDSRFRLPPEEPGIPAATGLVQATGRLPAIPRAHGPRWIGLKMHLHAPFALDANLEIHLGSDAYVGLSGVEDDRVNVCGLFRQRNVSDSTEEPLLERYLHACGLGVLRKRIETANIDPSSRSAVAGLDFARDTPSDHWVRLGDSYGMTPPYTGHGMAMAFESAALALDPLTAFARDEASWAETLVTIHNRHHNQFQPRLRHARWLHPVLYQPRWQGLLGFAARTRVLPMKSLYRLTHT